MNILILGSGGREHALAWKINKSPKCKDLFIAPGNAGTSQVGKNVDISLDDFDAIAKFISKKKIDMVIVGPEVPLVNGIEDYLIKKTEAIIVGPSKKGAKLEGSKEFAKKFMRKNHIPTAGYQAFTAEDIKKAEGFIYMHSSPTVLKADGLAAGKGVMIMDDKDEAITELHSMFDGKFGDAGNTVVIEQFLKGLEFSVFVLTDGQDWITLPVAKDYKRIGEKDKGLNTGGMGAISDPPFVDGTLMTKVEKRIVEPTIKGLKKAGIRYNGFIFFGLIRVGVDPYVIEYNCRLGDPETQAVLPRIKNDLVDLFIAMDEGTLKKQTVKAIEDITTTVIMASKGYPDSYEKGKTIDFQEPIPEDVLVFHAGTKKKDGNILTNGGRVLAVTGIGTSHQEAKKKANKYAKKIKFEGKYYRKDIGFDLK